MASKDFSDEDDLPCRVEGWLNVWDTDHDVEGKVFGDGKDPPEPPWEPFFCILRQDLKTLTCHYHEEDADDQPGLRELQRIRLDDGKAEFDKRWGYDTLQSIKENALQHEQEYQLSLRPPTSGMRHCKSAENLCSSSPRSTRRRISEFFLQVAGTPDRFCRSRLLDTCNESLPDLSHGFDQVDHSRRRHMLFRKFFHSSYEKFHERRGSVPLVSSTLDDRDDEMDTSSTPSRIAHFFLRKGFKSNLKRTKSVTKLDSRKRVASSGADSESNRIVSSLKRTMSLGRLNRKRNREPNGGQSEVPQHQNSLNIINSRIRSSRSHESLLSNSVTMHSIDLTSQEIDIKPLHASILGKEHCFQVSTSHGTKYISCRTSEEQQKWIGSLHRTVKPNQEHERRTDNSLKIWIKEAKNVPCKKRYFCEICLDQTKYARTSSKTKADMLFWGEHFEFNNLTPVKTVTVNLYREADKKKKKDKNCKIGYINIPVWEINGRQYVEKWFTASSGTVGKIGKENKSDLPLVRLRARYQTVNILPVDLYQDFTQYLTTDYCTLCDVMEQLVGVRDKEEIATTLVHIMQKLNKAKDYLTDVIITEVKRQENQHLTFRGNSIATKAMEAYMKLVGEKYLHDTLGDFIKQMIQSEDECEVDPTKLNNPASLPNHQRLLDMYCEMVWAKIINSHCYFPSELREVFSSFRQHCENDSGVADNLICGSIFLRFLCPAILSPSLFNLIQEYPPDRAARNLTLIAKTIQTLANSTKFGGKEEFMIFMNEFIDRHSDSMKQFLSQISSMEGGNQFLEYDGYIDLGKELSILHTFLVENLEKANEEMLAKLGKLPSILSKITDAIENPEVGKSVPNKRKSQIYDNQVNIMPPIGSSPTAIIRDMLRQSEDDIPVLGSRHAKHGSLDSRQMANDLNINDEYVRCKSVSTRLETEVSNVSVSARNVSDEQNINQSWNDIVNAAEGNHGDYIDLISFIDDDPQNSSMELEHNINGSQMSISQISTIASSGYQSYGYSQSNSPVDSAAQNDLSRDFSKTPNIQPLQPLSFSNPMYRHKLNLASNSSPSTTMSSINQGSMSCGSLSSEEDSSTIKNRSPIKPDKDLYQQSDRLRNLAPKLSSSSSSESLDQDKNRYSKNKEIGRNDNDPVKFDLHSSCPSRVFEDMHNSNFVTGQGYSLGRAPSRPVELSHTGSVDFSYLRQKFGDGMRRTATDSRIAQMSNPVQLQSDSGVSVSSSKSQMSPEDSPAHRRLSPQNAVHMGIRSVQRKIQEQEKTKQEYEQEVSVLRQQLQEAQKRLNSAEKKLQDHEAGTQQLVDDWQVRLEESEERMRRQQAEKDDQMKHIIQSERNLVRVELQSYVHTVPISPGDLHILGLMSVEDELRHDQEDMQNLVKQKQKVIEAQEKRIQTLDNANAKLMTALNQLRNVSQTHNGMIGPLRSTLISSEMAEFKTSSC